MHPLRRAVPAQLEEKFHLTGLLQHHGFFGSGPGVGRRDGAAEPFQHLPEKSGGAILLVEEPGKHRIHIPHQEPTAAPAPSNAQQAADFGHLRQKPRNPSPRRQAAPEHGTAGHILGPRGKIKVAGGSQNFAAELPGQMVGSGRHRLITQMQQGIVTVAERRLRLGRRFRRGHGLSGFAAQVSQLRQLPL